MSNNLYLQLITEFILKEKDIFRKTSFIATVSLPKVALKTINRLFSGIFSIYNAVFLFLKLSKSYNFRAKWKKIISLNNDNFMVALYAKAGIMSKAPAHYFAFGFSFRI